MDPRQISKTVIIQKDRKYTNIQGEDRLEEDSNIS